jgi:hypothetical protein
VNRRLTGRALAGAAAALVLTGGGVAVAAGNGSPNDPVPSGADDANSAPVAPEIVHPRGPGGPRFGLGFGGPAVGGPRAVARTAADYLGLSEEELRSKLGDGRSLAELARAQGKEVDGLIDALVKAATERLDRAVDDGWLGARARDAIARDLRSRITAFVNADLPQRPAFPGKDGSARRTWRGGPGCAPGAPDAPAPGDDGADRSGSDDESSTQPGNWSSGGGDGVVTA